MSEIDLRQTSYACPEQYDAFHDGHKVGYLRLRHGFFYVECPYVGGEEVYASATVGDGMFEASEREKHLSAAKDAILKWVKRRNENSEPPKP